MDDSRGKNGRDLDQEDAASTEGGMRKKKIIKSSCSLFSIFAVLLFIFLILCGGILYSKYRNFKLSFSGIKKSDNAIVTSRLQNEASSLKSGETAEIKVSDSDLNEIIKGSSGFPLKNPTAKIGSDQILLSGKTSSGFWGIPLNIGIVPEAKSGKLVFNIKEIKTAGVPAPKQISDSINSNLQQYLNSSLPLANDINVTAVKLETGLLTITGQKR